MRRYEKMTKEEIIKFFDCDNKECADCPASKQGTIVSDCAIEYLTEEIEMKPRWQTAKTQEDFDKFISEFYKVCESNSSEHFGCTKCRLRGSTITRCYHAYLSELVEVQE